MEEIETRLKEATDVCLKCHTEWNKDQKDSKARENLMEAVHELRKVAARLEIQIAISERNEMASKPIPIPAHRSNKRQQHENNGDDNLGNADAGQPPSGGGGRPPGGSSSNNRPHTGRTLRRRTVSEPKASE
ncbi:MAG: hypothetical protein CO093_10320 [Alphaproteobacteria bacterium CG_4_9_14_3_um_filter_47_13]|nr:MAG: hypothetical protein CO093_10320 [Alphaproteobacteria bacterium CG_4_9_14_3_um_filter_47_13]